MEGLLCHWALAMQEYNFIIVYHQGTLNGNVDALSHLPTSTVAMTSARKKTITIMQAQQDDPILNQTYHALFAFKREAN